VSEMRVLFHVGWPKTATTSMQSHLRGYPNLAGKPHGRDGAAQAIGVVDELIRHRDWSPDALSSLLSSSHRDPTNPVILSDEALIAMPQREWFEGLVGPFESARRLAAAPGDKQVLFTLRNPRSMLRSTWLHHLREGRTQSYHDCLDRVTKDRRMGTGPFAMLALVEQYVDLFGQNALFLAFSEDYFRDPADFWKRFTTTFEVKDFVADTSAPRLNETVLGPVGFELAVNHVLRIVGTATRHRSALPLRRRMTRTVSRHLRSDHASYFAKSNGFEDALVADLEADIATIRRIVTVL
jgi:hypothetical protein